MKKTVTLLLITAMLLSTMMSFASAGGSEGTLRELYFCGFESQEEFDRWTNIDYDNMSNGWIRQKGAALAPAGEYFVSSYSFINASIADTFGGNSGVQAPDNWLVSPKMTLPESDEIYLSLNVFALDANNASETYSIIVHPIDGNLNIVADGTLSASDGFSNPKSIEVNIGRFAGQEVEIILRHFNSNNQLAIGMDNVAISYMDTANVEIETVGIHVQTPSVGTKILNEGTADAEGYYVADVIWEPMDSNFLEGKSYCVRATLEAKQGYFFPHIDSIRPTINGMSAQLLSHSNDQIEISYIFDPLLSNFIDIGYDYSAVQIMLHENFTLEAKYTLPEGASNVTHQWYVADAPQTWGAAIEGATGKILGVPNDEECVKYYHCYVTCEVNGETLSTPTKEFDTVMVEVKGSGVPSMFFDDVTIYDWFYHDVEYVYYNLLMYGTGPNLFSPQTPTTRGMIVTVLHRIEGKPEPSAPCPFTDVRSGSYYEKAIAWAAENDIVNGMGEGKFAPDDKITREQIAAILYRYAIKKGFYNEDDCAMLSGFADQNKVSGWAEKAMSWAFGVGLINGSNEPDGLFLMPQGYALRCQVAAILHRLCATFIDS